ncbi:ScyD/ScyE family protein [Mesorhizobium sp. M00.F.Ca.ET.216.01.1.1]|uniref:ScyD/ScyE family protein n=1 Tax=Mesorhizobium sp. M00.F.Ca.ET.216.01.1.1 TaxID=2500528 RepID=UPI000FDB2DBA|nr:ScyD/ScyE family protein [Mesorhizobium sp. M00.F.Ca.ET.216.01.1.1]TGQ46918.1 ScyD/ScyE family protein [Mesorhizobium sp. M00.F.Ca.ET.216.01.1.1]
MRTLTGLIALSLMAIATQGSAEPKAASGYEVEIVRKPGAIFAGLVRDGDALLVTDLADGRLYRRSPDGRFTAFGPVLPHGTDVMGDPTGPYRVERHGNGYLVAQGWTPADHDEDSNDHAMLEVDEGAVTRVVSNDFWNPYDFALSGDTLYVVDAARNSVERLLADGSDRTQLFAFARLSTSGQALTALSPTEFGDKQKYDFDAVPTGIAVHGGRLYVSLFGGFPFVAGSGRIVSLPQAGQTSSARIEAVGLNAPVDVVFDTKGGMLVLEHGTFDQSDGWASGSGRLLGLDLVSGKRQVLLDGLTRPVDVLPFDNVAIVVSQLDGKLVFLKQAGPAQPHP